MEKKEEKQMMCYLWMEKPFYSLKTMEDTRGGETDSILKIWNAFGLKYKIRNEK